MKSMFDRGQAIRLGLLVSMFVGVGVTACGDVAPVDPAATDGVSQTTDELRFPRRCGGPRDLQCPADQYCNAVNSDLCPSDGFFGRCAVKPRICPDIFQPVCGCNGKTYPNACAAAAGGAAVEHAGACKAPPASCGGIAGIPCPDGEKCIDDPTDDCDPAKGGADCGGICTPASTFCGGIAGIPCPAGQRCVDDPSDGCDPTAGGADCGGICVSAPLGTPCGKTTCGAGLFCCNASCGVCTPHGLACSQIACEQ